MSACNTQVTSAFVAADCATWPAADQAAWRAAFDPVHGRRRVSWVRQTQYQNAGVFTRYLACVTRHGLPPDLHTVGVKAFITECQAAGRTAITIAGYVESLWKRDGHSAVLAGGTRLAQGDERQSEQHC